MRPRWKARAWPIIIVLSAAALALAMHAHAVAPLRHVLGLWFLVVCPGMAFVPALDLQDRVAEYTIGVALSLAIDTIVAGILVYAGWWSPEGSLAGIISVSIVGVALCLLWSTFARRGGQTG